MVSQGTIGSKEERRVNGQIIRFLKHCVQLDPENSEAG